MGCSTPGFPVHHQLPSLLRNVWELPGISCLKVTCPRERIHGHPQKSVCDTAALMTAGQSLSGCRPPSVLIRVERKGLLEEAPSVITTFVFCSPKRLTKGICRVQTRPFTDPICASLQEPGDVTQQASRKWVINIRMEWTCFLFSLVGCRDTTPGRPGDLQ